LPEKAIPEMTYTVSGGTLNPTHSLTGRKKISEISSLSKKLFKKSLSSND